MTGAIPFDQVVGLLVVVVGGVCTVIFQAWALIRYLEARREKANEAIIVKMETISRELHSRVSEVRREYVEKVQYKQDMDRLEKEIEKIERSVKAGFDSQSVRLDKIIAFTAGSKGG